ncbi:MAG: amidohydrolase [Acidobacteria bacterium]|nr:MAG: amidohydrolase [Acidobacteriota bacterium]REJ99634.1 MAG: amidohydrolase [Acidobacteriota bacterium]
MSRGEGGLVRAASTRLGPVAAILLLGVAGLVACDRGAHDVAMADSQPVEWLLHSGSVMVCDAAGTVHQAIALRGGRIVALGSDAELRARFRAEREIDLAGRSVTPGFVDSHTHIIGVAARHVDLEAVPSVAEMQRRVAERAAELGPGEWITGYGWSEDELAEARLPTRHDLDAAAPHNPVVLTRAGAHSAVASSAALALAGLDRSSPDPPRGFLGRDVAGELDGIVGERQDLLLDLVPPASPEELSRSLRHQLTEQFAHGITTLVHANATLDELPLWRAAYEEAAAAGEVLPRAAVQVIWPGVEGSRGLRAAFEGMVGVEADRLRLGAIKIFVDGGFTGPAAFTREPYASAGQPGGTEPGYRGALNFGEELLARAVLDAHRDGWQLGIHAIGDAAIELTVDWLVAALEAVPREDHRHYLNHFTVLPSAETMERMARHQIAITQQPNFTFSVEGRYLRHLDGERLERNNALRTPLGHGLHLAISSDILPIGPMVGLEAALTRRGRSGRVYAPDEALGLQEALRAMTWAGAWLLFEEDAFGTLEEGKVADLVVLSEDLRQVPPEELDRVVAEHTFVDGVPVFERRR